MKTIKINRYHNKKGNSYSTKDENECLDLICKKLKIDSNPKMDNNYSSNIQKYLNIESQVKKQYNCNLRTIDFVIDLKN